MNHCKFDSATRRNKQIELWTGPPHSPPDRGRKQAFWAQENGGSKASKRVDGRSSLELPMSICGLDFGTSNTTLGTIAGREPVLTALEGDHTTIPSAIFYG